MGCVLLAHETLRLLEQGSPSQLLSGVDSPTCKDASGVLPLKASCCARTWSTEMPLASSLPSATLTESASTHVSHAPLRRPWLGSTCEVPSLLNTDPFSRFAKTLSFDFSEAPNGSSIED